MKQRWLYFFKSSLYTSSFLILLFLSGCLQGNIKPITNFNSMIEKSNRSFRDPTLGSNFLVGIVTLEGKERIELFDLRARKKIALPGLNRADSQPISVSISSDSQRLAFVRQRLDQTELLIYRRFLGTLQLIELIPKGIPRKVTFDGSGRVLAVQVSRGGRWEIDMIRLQN